ncbi:MAG: AAA family ATPase [Rhodospirillales bacterium]
MAGRIHITGPSGSGTTTLGQALARRWSCLHLDSDDFLWEPTDPPYQTMRARDERVSLLQAAIGEAKAWTLSGSLCGWGDGMIPRFDLVVFLTVPTEERLGRLARRESARFGAAIAPGGVMHDSHIEFLIWAGSYDDGAATQRSRALHEAWLARLPCPVLRLDGRTPLNDLVGAVESAIP